MSKESEVDQVGCVAGSQPKVLAVRRPDGTYETRYGVTTPKLASIDLDIDPALLEPSPRPRVLSVIDAALARLHGRELQEKEQCHFGLDVGAGLPAEVVERIRADIYHSTDED